MLIIICGLPGTGKTTLAKALAKKFHLTHISTDIIRKKHFKHREYSKKEKMKVYSLVFSEAEKELVVGKNIALDGTFYKSTLRKTAYSLAKKYKTKFFIIECTISENEIKKRIEKREKTKNASEADFKTYKKVNLQFNQIKEKHLKINCAENMTSKIKKVAAWIKPS